MYHAGKVDEVVEKIWLENDKQLRKAVGAGYSKKQFDEIDFDNAYQLNSNVAIFSAFKSYRVKEELNVNLTDPNGRKLPFHEFLEQYQKIDSKYNKNWLRAEYNMAQRQAQAAVQWSDFERAKHLYPNLEYMPSRSAEPRLDHQKYYGTILPIDDPFWDTAMPPLEWGCKCSVRQTDATPVPPNGAAPLEIPGVAGNAGKTQQIFTPDHPYVMASSATEKALIAKFLNKQRQVHHQDAYITAKVGKGKVSVSLIADSNELNKNINDAVVYARKYNDTIVVRPHLVNQKNPEFYSTKYKMVGDATQFDGSNIESYYKSSFKKYNKGEQLYDYDKSFLYLNFFDKLNDDNFQYAMRRLKGYFINRSKCNFLIIRVKDNVLRIDDFGSTKEFDIIVSKMRKELLE